MKLTIAAAHQILLELTSQEVQCFGLSDETPAKDNLRQTLQRILAAVAMTTGRSFKLLRCVRADVLPDRAGGCLLLISGLDEQTAAAQRLCFFAETEDELIDAARVACAIGNSTLEITLLQTAGGYYLLTPPLSERLTHQLSEFMRVHVLDKAAEAVLLEQAVPLLQHKPLSVLCGGA